LASEYAGVGWLIMPTDLGAASERKRKAAQAQAQTETTILLVVVIISLVTLVLLVADQSFASVTIEMTGLLAPQPRTRNEMILRPLLVA
jgi:hypothetical protein